MILRAAWPPSPRRLEDLRLMGSPGPPLAGRVLLPCGSGSAVLAVSPFGLWLNGNRLLELIGGAVMRQRRTLAATKRARWLTKRN